MAIEKKLIHFNSKEDFESRLKNGEIKETSIIFIKDAKEIWTHGTYYNCNELPEGLLTIDEAKNLFSDKTISPYPEQNQVVYETTDGEPITLNNSNIASNIYYKDKGFGIITYKGDEIVYTSFENRPTLKKCISPKEVTTMTQMHKFNNCVNLEEVNIPEGITNIINNGFDNCNKLKDITLPNSLTTIGSYAFRKCYNLINIILPENLQRINSYAFIDCVSIKKIEFPKSLTYMEDGLFNACRSLTSVVFRNTNTIEYFGKNMFASCHSFKLLDGFPVLKNIPDGTFVSTSLNKITLSYENETIGDQAFQNTLLGGLNINSVTIGYRAFSDCNHISYLNIGSRCTTIKDGAFANCSGVRVFIYQPSKMYETTGGNSLQISPQVFDCYSSEIVPGANPAWLHTLILRYNGIVQDVDTYVAPATYEGLVEQGFLGSDTSKETLIEIGAMNNDSDVISKEGMEIIKSASKSRSANGGIMPLKNLDEYVGVPKNWLKIYVPANWLARYRERYPTLYNYFHPIEGNETYINNLELSLGNVVRDSKSIEITEDKQAVNTLPGLTFHKGDYFNVYAENSTGADTTLQFVGADGVIGASVQLAQNKKTTVRTVRLQQECTGIQWTGAQGTVTKLCIVKGETSNLNEWVPCLYDENLTKKEADALYQPKGELPKEVATKEELKDLEFLVETLNEGLGQVEQNQAEDLAKITELQGKLNGVTNLSEQLAGIPTLQIGAQGEANNYIFSDKTKAGFGAVSATKFVQEENKLFAKCRYWGDSDFNNRTQVPVATTTADGAMSKDDKKNLNLAVEKLNDLPDVDNLVTKEELEDALYESTINGHEYVDLGLPSRLLWATCNIGASRPENTGLYFAWGETEGYTEGEKPDGYTWETYKFGGNDNGNQSKYNSYDGLLTLQPEDDAAHVNMGGDWRMPTKDDFLELIENTEPGDGADEIGYISNYNGTGVNGILRKGKNGNSIFFPSTYALDNIHYVNGKGGNNYYFSSSKKSESINGRRDAFEFYPSDPGKYSGSVTVIPSVYAYIGTNIRGVIEPKLYKPKYLTKTEGDKLYKDNVIPFAGVLKNYRIAGTSNNISEYIKTPEKYLYYLAEDKCFGIGIAEIDDDNSRPQSDFVRFKFTGIIDFYDFKDDVQHLGNIVTDLYTNLVPKANSIYSVYYNGLEIDHKYIVYNKKLKPLFDVNDGDYMLKNGIIVDSDWYCKTYVYNNSDYVSVRDNVLGVIVDAKKHLLMMLDKCFMYNHYRTDIRYDQMLGSNTMAIPTNLNNQIGLADDCTKADKLFKMFAQANIKLYNLPKDNPTCSSNYFPCFYHKANSYDTISYSYIATENEAKKMCKISSKITQIRANLLDSKKHPDEYVYKFTTITPKLFSEDTYYDDWEERKFDLIPGHPIEGLKVFNIITGKEEVETQSYSNTFENPLAVLYLYE